MSCQPSGEADFCLTQGLAVSLVYQFEPTYDLSDITEALFTVKEYLDDDPSDQDAVITSEGIINVLAHRVTVALSEDDTRLLQPSRFYWYDLVLTDGGGPAVATCLGRLSVSPTVTNRSFV